jgi:hypothetical protein
MAVLQLCIGTYDLLPVGLLHHAHYGLVPSCQNVIVAFVMLMASLLPS